MLKAPDNEKGKSDTTVNNVRHLAVVNSRVVANHSWYDTKQYGQPIYTCRKCGIMRKRITVKTLMAIVNGRDVYKYERKWNYFTKTRNIGIKRPQCHIESNATT